MPASTIRYSVKSLFFGLSLLLACGCSAGNKQNLNGINSKLNPEASPLEVLEYFEGIPYRADGVINHSGEFTLFADQQARPATPGLNCSGFVVAASRYFFKQNYALNDLLVDRRGDSGPDAVKGEDWDFGYDLILNVTEGLPRRIMLPYGQSAAIEKSNGAELRGFGLADLDAWTEVLSRMTPQHVYLFSMSKPVRFKNYSLLHYHVGVIVPDHQGHLWLGQATLKGGVNRIDISAPNSLKAVIAANPDSSRGKRKILIVEAPLSAATDK